MNSPHTIFSHRIHPSRPFQIALLLAALTVAIPLRAAENSRPIADATNSMLHPALEISLFAKEPDVVDPVALCFDADGRMYVVEMRDYPYGFGPERKPGGTVRLLDDTNGDGRADRSTLFAESLSFPTSIAPWNSGVLVAAPPEIIFLKDLNGDGRADTREVLLKGFTLGVTDSNMNGLRWGLDNRVHGLNGGNSGAITSTRQPGAPVPLRNFDFSLNPATGDFITTYHTSAGFGLVFDDWGRSFVTYNINHFQQRIIPVRYLQRSPGFPPVEATESISDHGDMARIYPISEPETRVNHPEQSGHFSSAGGMGYLGAAHFPGDLPGSVLVCDVVGNLVHRDVLRANGPVFTAIRPPSEQASEFFASRDAAFRPIGIELGPDGALYLIDMQRDVIEHPDYIPEKVKAKLDIRAGDDRGRIYRLTPRAGLPQRKPDLGGASAATLVNELSDPNQWRRYTAQRLVVERQDKTAVAQLKELAASGKEPRGRLHALWTLQGLNALDESTVNNALADAHPGIRENGLLLAERFLPGAKNLEGKILSLVDDPSARVRFQASLTIGQFDSPKNNSALLTVVRKDYTHRWSRLAALNSIRSGAETMLDSLVRNTEFTKEMADSKVALIRELADLVGARQDRVPAALTTLSDAKVDPKFQLAGLEGLQTGVARSGGKVAVDARTTSALEKLSRSESPTLLAAAWTLSRILGVPETDAQREALNQAMRRARDRSLPAEKRNESIRLLALGNYAVVSESLLGALEGTEPSAIQSAAIDVLRQFPDNDVARNLVARWRALAPAVRPAVIGLLLQRIPFHETLVEAIETEKIKLGELNLDLEQRRRLLRESTPEIKTRAAKFIGDEEYSNRKATVEEWLKKLPPTGDARQGKTLFEKTCAQCHVLGGIGQQAGPDLAAVAHRSVEDLASNILDPNMAIAPNYVTYSVETNEGEFETGMLQSESAEAITLMQAQGKQVVVPRNRIKRMEATGLSLMPEGLEAGMTPADLRDLIAFLQIKR